MSLKSKANIIRRKVMHSLTHNVGKKSISEMQKKANQFQVNRVLISRPNHRLGNMLLITPLVQEIANTFPNCTIDLFVKGKITPIIFQNYPQVNQIIELPKKPLKEFSEYLKVWFSLKKTRYDLVINVEKNSSSGRISTLIPSANFKFYGDDFEELQNKYPDIKHIAKYPVYNFRRFLEVLHQKPLQGYAPVLDIKLSEQEIEKGKNDLEQITKNQTKKTIAFFTFATGTKCYSVDWWTEFYEKFYPKYKDEYHLIEILPVEDISQLERKLPTYYSKEIREIAALMANCELIVAADSGMMHLSSASKTPTVGLFSVTQPQVYAPYGNHSTYIDTNTQTKEDIITVMDDILQNIKNSK
ncbi:glycosyltransferase family 9 protein [Flavobacterium sp. xlx-214]|uniref:glycosyltransferase family 9 protein n=1 Tax=unclassified Flavobacterium TaxID=196869 RepID=UPI0013D7541F|nr:MULTISPECIES: glycosyltransferase family 9 protein [unclassified Flavobacterium]MBA5791861.1 glycosyltransferase family 9 protein [Flavobacterium sp. xlx-221]QMI83098.1 glycosyltransferase family 9 protein [Flavobacterium sp. xlx-214]